MKDPIVDEVRRHRMEHTQKFAGDIVAICKDLRRAQDASGHSIVRLPAKRLEEAVKTSGTRTRRGA